jgi:outer membrane protein TolC
MGEPLDRQFDLRAPIPAEDALPPVTTLEEEAITTRPESLRAAANERLAREAITSARAGFLPQAALQGSYEANGGTFTDRASAWTVGAVLRWNVFSGFSDSARLGEARAALQRAQADRQRQDAQIRVDVRTALAAVESARARLEVGRAAAAQARESQRIIRDRYDAGLASVNDLLRSSDAVLEADALQTSATVDAIVSAAMLERARGK